MSDKPNITITPLNTYKVHVQGPSALYTWWQQHHFQVPGSHFMPSVRAKRWDGMWRPSPTCRTSDGTTYELQCSRGMIGRLERTFTAHGNEPLVDQASMMTWLNTQLPNLPEELRVYQNAAFMAVLLQGWVRIALATNAGKGAVIGLLAKYCAEHDMSCTILADEVAVYEALEEQMLEWGNITPTHIKQGISKVPPAGITLAMIPTLSRRLGRQHSPKTRPWREWVMQQDMLLLDEADKATANSWRRVLSFAHNAKWRAGFSGTFPEESVDPYADIQLENLMGPVVVRAKNVEMIRQGVSAKPTVYVHKFDASHHIPIPANRKRWYKDGKDRPPLTGTALRNYLYHEAVWCNVERHHFIARLIRPDVSTAVIINRIQHGENLADVIPNSTFIDGSKTIPERHEALEAFERGDIHVLIVTKILDRGTNRLGHAADIIFAGAEGSSRQTLQRIGRGLRRTGGKEFLNIVDVVDKGHTYLHTAAEKRLTLYNNEQFIAKVEAHET